MDNTSFNFTVFRKFITTNNGKRVLLRPLLEEDQKRLYEMFKEAPDGDLTFLKDNVRDPQLIEKWTANINYGRVLSLVAVSDDKIVGDCTLHLGRKSQRHIAEIRIFLTEEFRGVGLGSKMLNEAEEISKKLGLKFIMAQVILDHVGLVKAFRRLGYDLRCTLDDYFLSAEGTSYDVAFLVKRLSRQDFTF